MKRCRHSTGWTVLGAKPDGTPVIMRCPQCRMTKHRNYDAYADEWLDGWHPGPQPMAVNGPDGEEPLGPRESA